MIDKNGFYGNYGGQFVPETLIPALDELKNSFDKLKNDEDFLKEFHYYLKNYVGRETPLYFAERLSEETGVNIYLKREDLLHTGAHKVNNTLGQALLTRYMGKKRVIAETGAGQHGVATATMSARFGLECSIFMGALDVERQAPNVKRMKMLGAEVIPVKDGSNTLKDAMNAALRDWVATVETTHYIVGTVAGPHPFPELVAFFQSVIGDEAKKQCAEYGFTPDVVVACIGGGSNAIGIFRGFLDAKDVRIVGVEAGGFGDRDAEHARSIGLGKPGILHGCLTYLMQDEFAQVADVHSVSAGLDYPGVGPEHSYLNDTGRVEYSYVLDKEALEALKKLTLVEGILPALESSHAIAWVLKNADELRGKNVVVNLQEGGTRICLFLIPPVF